ncbi:pyridoxal phosphate-dependent decarboxylase family protein [Leptolyngbya sp. PCC 6406]|uniref:pyridoxal phosphate-dependent decarboxylase family protein n=1 Tax=Leptolyngbya sp. PCC 6406 TaxID=1173264 RepID=UPI0002ABE86D|nr:pyridoxal-dependent decarboxylase [Leptolyngbya sp. PCC 6406]
MDRTVLPATAFIDPSGHNRAEIEILMQRVSQQILDHLSGAGLESPLPSSAPAQFSALLPDLPAGTEVLLEQIQQVLAQAMNPAHPGYLGHMDPLPSTFSLLGDWVAAALNNNMLSVEMSPPFSRLELLLLRAIAQMFGLGAEAGGLLVSGGSLANLQAIAVARNVKLGTLTTGLSQRSRPPVLFTSELAHTSIRKAAMVLGLGTEAAIAVPTNDQNQMDPLALKTAIVSAIAAGQEPFAIVATAGTTVTGSIDPLPDLAAIARAHGLWFHVDAAYGGALVFSPRHRHRLQGIEQADSVTFNPQKWLYVTKTCASVLFRQFQYLHRHFQIAAPYMNTEEDWPNLGELTIQGTRHVDVLKLWLTLQHFGKQGCAALIDASYDLTAHFLQNLRQRPYLTLASEPEMNVICWRGSPPDLPRDRWDEWNIALQQYLLTQGNTFLSLPLYRHQRWFKAVLLNPFTTPAHLDALFYHIDAFATLPSAGV